MWHVVWSCSTFLLSTIKIFQGVFDLQSGHEINGLSLSNITKGDNTKTKKGKVVILVPTHHLVLFYISAKYHRNSPKGIRVTERTWNLFQIKQRVICYSVWPQSALFANASPGVTDNPLYTALWSHSNKNSAAINNLYLDFSQTPFVWINSFGERQSCGQQQ